MGLWAGVISMPPTILGPASQGLSGYKAAKITHYLSMRESMKKKAVFQLFGYTLINLVWVFCNISFILGFLALLLNYLIPTVPGPFNLACSTNCYLSSFISMNNGQQN